MLCFQLKQIILLFSGENKDKKYYNEGNISPSMAIKPIVSLQLTSSIKIYIIKEGYELLSLYFNRPKT
jgi:hypothetical protein